MRFSVLHILLNYITIIQDNCSRTNIVWYHNSIFHDYNFYMIVSNIININHSGNLAILCYLTSIYSNNKSLIRIIKFLTM